MNAQTPIADPLTEAAIKNPDVLRVLAQGPVANQIEVARRAQVSTKNIGRTLERLERDGLAAETPEIGWSLTAAGLRAHQAIQLARGELEAGADDPGGVLLLRHEQLRPNPLQPRKHIDEQELEELAATIHDAGDVLQNLVVFPADAEGVHDIAAGERRWRAVGLLIERGLWPTDRRLRAIERERSKGMVSYLALVENGQRANLTMLEQARAYADLVAELQCSARAAALRTGRDPRTVQEMLKVLAEADPADIATHEAGDMTWEQLRNSVKEHRPAEPEPSQIDVEEVAAVKKYPDPTSPEGIAKLAEARAALEAYDAGIRAKNEEAACRAAAAYDEVVHWFNGGDSVGCAVGDGDRPAASQVVAQALREPIGAIPKLWGQYGLFMVEVCGVQVIVEAKAHVSKWVPGGDFDLWAAKPEAPFFSETGSRAVMSLSGPHGPAEAIVRHMAWLMAQRDHKPRPITEDAQARLATKQWPLMAPLYVPASWETVDDPRIFNGFLFPNAARAAEARRLAEGGGPSNSGGSRRVDPKPAAEISLNAVELLTLMEVAHKTYEAGREGAEGLSWARVGKYWLDAAASALSTHRLIQFSHSQPNGPCVTLTEAGALFLTKAGHSIGGINRGALALARQKANLPGADGAYSAAWLNTEPEAPAPALAEPQDGQEADDQAWAEDPPATGLLPVVEQALESADDFDRPALFERAGIAFPLRPGTGAELGVIFDANNVAVLTVDSDGHLHNDDVKARVMLIMATLNAAVVEAGGLLDGDANQKGEAPAVPIRRSITPDWIVCLEDGRKFRSLTHHLQATYGLTPDGYRARWGLPADYPMVAPNYSKERWDALRPLASL